MAKRVVVIASGETERSALPPLVQHLAAAGVVVEDVRIPPRHGAITAKIADKIIRSVWFERTAPERPAKFVVLLDTDRSHPEDVLDPMRATLPTRLRDIDAGVQFAVAQPHLEAWYFADDAGLRKYLKRSLGNVDSSRPDAIQNPKLHLEHLLDGPYTSRVSGEIASSLDADAIANRSPSFRGFIAAVKNGPTRASSPQAQPR